MRFILSIIIWIIFVGGMWLYTWQRDAGLPSGPAAFQAVEQLEGDYSVEITPTFSIENDPFALQTDAQSSSPLELRINGISIEVPTGELRRGERVEIRDLPNMQAGFNEVYVKASPPINENIMDHGLRVRLIDKNYVILDDTIWGSGGALVSGTISFTIAPTEDDNHDH